MDQPTSTLYFNPQPLRKKTRNRPIQFVHQRKPEDGFTNNTTSSRLSEDTKYQLVNPKPQYLTFDQQHLQQLADKVSSLRKTVSVNKLVNERRTQ